MDSKEVFTFTGGPPPNWLESHSWYAPVRVAPAEIMPLVGLKKLELKMAMCCMKCAEIISEELREVPSECFQWIGHADQTPWIKFAMVMEMLPAHAGVMDVQVDFKLKKVIVIGAPFAADVLKKAKKVDRKAEWWSASPDGASPLKEEKKEGKKEGKKQEKKKEEKKEEEKVEEKEVKKEVKKEEKKEEKEEKKEGDGKKARGKAKGNHQHQHQHQR